MVMWGRTNYYTVKTCLNRTFLRQMFVFRIDVLYFIFYLHVYRIVFYSGFGLDISYIRTFIYSLYRILLYLGFSLVQQYFSYIVAVSFFRGGNRNTRRKTTDLLQVTDKLLHNVVSSTPHLIGIRTHNVSGDG
jgi:hypothetical protein